MAEGDDNRALPVAVRDERREVEAEGRDDRLLRRIGWLIRLGVGGWVGFGLLALGHAYCGAAS